MLFTVSVYDPFLLDGDQCGVVEADSIAEATAQVQTWVVGRLDNDYQLTEAIICVEGPDQWELVVKTENKEEGRRGEETVVIRPVESPLMFLAEDWASVFD